MGHSAAVWVVIGIGTVPTLLSSQKTVDQTHPAARRTVAAGLFF